jgi:hypothetical protein
MGNMSKYRHRQELSEEAPITHEIISRTNNQDGMTLKSLCSKGSNLVKRSSLRIGEKSLHSAWMLMGCKWGRIFKNSKMYKKLDKQLTQ